MQSATSQHSPEGGYPQGLREVSVPRADAGVRHALRSAYASCNDLPPEFAKLLDRLR